ncbi:hypothetical protein [Bifidobacterium longum]|nr:hypothetical protein [Bifidobacterium longum]UIP50341.1 hypothetical protein LZF93_04085 [Bifidobacterium longum]
MNIFPSALKHGIEPDDAMYVVEHPLRDLVLREDPPQGPVSGYITGWPSTGGGGGRHIEGAGAHPCDAHEDPIRETAGRRQAMDMNYDILSYDELPADEAAMLKADAEEAERGYTDEQLSEALKRTPGRPLAVGSTPASNVIRVRLDDERDAKLERYMRKHHMSRSNAVRTLLDKALAEI